MKRGFFITVEGQDGAGKSSNIETIADTLKAHAIPYILTREPGGTQLGEQLRSLILDKNNNNISDLSEVLVMFSARAQLLKEVIEPHLSNGCTVVSDRFSDATMAYQGGGRGVDVKVIESLKTLVHPNTAPDLTLLLDVPIQVGESRTLDRGAPDRFELENAQFKQRVRNAYLELARKEPHRVKTIDASKSIATVQANVRGVVNQLIAERIGSD